jgi:hypothetical protein
VKILAAIENGAPKASCLAIKCASFVDSEIRMRTIKRSVICHSANGLRLAPPSRADLGPIEVLIAGLTR